MPHTFEKNGIPLDPGGHALLRIPHIPVSALAKTKNMHFYHRPKTLTEPHSFSAKSLYF
jgi:hypothetical protein